MSMFGKCTCPPRWNPLAPLQHQPGCPSVAPNCRGCGKPLVYNETIADACPCNAPRGINHGLVPAHVCACDECDPAQTGSARKLDSESWAKCMPGIVRQKAAT